MLGIGQFLAESIESKDNGSRFEKLAEGEYWLSVPLKPSGGSWDLDVDAVRAAVTDKTAMVIVNSPHNPTGSVFSRAALEGLRDICVEHDLLVLSDEVYEDLTFDDDSSSPRLHSANFAANTQLAQEVAAAVPGRNVSEIALGWLLSKDVVPIAKSPFASGE